jgi:hypothetical protein
MGNLHVQIVCARGIGGVALLPTSKLEAGAEQAGTTRGGGERLVG